MQRHLVVAVVIASICTSCKIPDDPQHTLEHIRGGTMRVGVIENRPWVERINDQPTGVEVELVRQFAQELDAKIEWVWGPENEILKALKHYELDLAIGGLTKSTPWQKEIGITNPYFTDRILVGFPPNLSPIKNAEIEGVQVAVAQENAVVAAYVKKEDAVPVRVTEPFGANKPVAAPSWQLKHEGFTVTDIELSKEKHIMAVPPGENGWLVRLERFLRGKRSQIAKMLKEAQP